MEREEKMKRSRTSRLLSFRCMEVVAYIRNTSEKCIMSAIITSAVRKKIIFARDDDVGKILGKFNFLVDFFDRFFFGRNDE